MKLYRVKPGYDVSRPVSLAALSECLEEVEVVRSGYLLLPHDGVGASVVPASLHPKSIMADRVAIVRIPEDNE